MLIGLKVVPQTKKTYVDELIDFFDFIEIFAVVECEYDYLKSYDKQIVVHCEHSEYGTNFCDKNKEKKNKEALDWAKKMADKFNSDKIIIHPEFVEIGSDSFSLDNLINFIKDNYDNRLLIESMPFLIPPKGGARQCLCHSFDEIKKVMNECNIGMCLDLSHSAGSALHKDINVSKFIGRLISLNPAHFHISDVDYKKGDEVHLNFFEGNLDMDEIKRLIPSNAEVTLETPPNVGKQIYEVRFLKRL